MTTVRGPAGTPRREATGLAAGWHTPAARPVGRRMRERVCRATTAAVVGLTACAPSPAERRAGEALWYMTNSERSVQSFLAHAGRIDIIAPQGYSLDSTGRLAGAIDPRIMQHARDARVRVMPLIMNEGFDQAVAHQLLDDRRSRQRALRTLAALCREEHLYGLQLDFEQVHVTDRALLSAFVADAAHAAHEAGCVLSVAVVPRENDDAGQTPHEAWMHRNWRGAYDYARLAAAADFLSVMTYAQHTRMTPPGAIAGKPWMQRSLDFIVGGGVPTEKISLGIPTYSQGWTRRPDSPSPAWTSRALSYTEAREMIDAGGGGRGWSEAEEEEVAVQNGPGTRTQLAISDARSFQARTQLVRAYRLRGYSAWVLGTEDPGVWARAHP